MFRGIQRSFFHSHIFLINFPKMRIVCFIHLYVSKMIDITKVVSLCQYIAGLSLVTDDNHTIDQ